VSRDRPGDAEALLRTRDAAMRSVQVVAPERRPMERVVGREFGDFMRRLYEG
jgi:hypothetical protein